MSYKLRDLKDINDFNFSKEAEAIYNYLMKNWMIKAKPKGYDKYLKTYTDYAGMDELDEEALQKSFEGHGDAPTVSHPFVTSVSLPHVAYDDTNQGRNPLRVMIAAVLTHGILFGQRMAYFDEHSDCRHRMSRAKHAYDKAKTTYNPELYKIHIQEFEKYFMDEYFGIPTDQIKKEYEALFEQALQNKLTESVIACVPEKGSVTISSQSKGKLKEFWGVLFELYMLGNENEFKERLSKLGFNIRRSERKRIIFILSKKKGAPKL
jgi:hypothetical protein